MSDGGSSSITVPEGFALHTENTSHILISSKEEAFLNPVQEFNRDLSVACIRVWSEELNREKEAKWKQSQERRAKREALAGGEAKMGQQKKAKTESTEPSNGPEDGLPGDVPASEAISEGSKREYRPHKFVLLEALSATGLRSIRYAKEIPLVRFVLEFCGQTCVSTPFKICDCERPVCVCHGCHEEKCRTQWSWTSIS